MSDNVENQLRRLSAGLGSVRWADVAALRVRARRRRLRAVVGAPLAVVAVVVAVWASTATPTGRTAPATAATPTPTMASPDAPSFIPKAAMLQPEDVGPGTVADHDEAWPAHTYRAFPLGMDSCPGFAPLKISSFTDSVFMRHRNLTGGPGLVWTETFRYADATAAQVMTDARRYVSACPFWTSNSDESSTPDNPSHIEFRLTVVDQGFAGDDSLLLRQNYRSVFNATGKPTGNQLTSITAMVRVGDLVGFIHVELDNPDVVRNLAVRLATRLCAGTSTC